MERNCISSLQSHGKALERNVVSWLSSVIVAMPAILLCELNGHLVPCTSCFYGKWEKMFVLANLEYLSILFCAVFLAAAPGLVAVLDVFIYYYYYYYYY